MIEEYRDDNIDDKTAQWLNREITSGELEQTEESEEPLPGYVRYLIRQAIVQSCLAAVLMWPVIPFVASKILVPLQQQATLSQVNPDSDQRSVQKWIFLLDPFYVVVVAEMLTLGSWAYFCLPNLRKLHSIKETQK